MSRRQRKSTGLASSPIVVRCGLVLCGLFIPLAIGCDMVSAPASRLSPAVSLRAVGSDASETIDETEEQPADTTAQGSSELPPNIVQALAEFNHGAAYMEKYDYAKAAQAFSKVVEAVPDWTAARFNRGLAYLNMAGENNPDKRLGPTKEMVDTAIATFESIIKDDPDSLNAAFCLGMMNAYLGNAEAALGYFQKVYAREPDDNFVAYSYAKALRSLDRNDEAIPVLEKIVERDRGFVSAVYLLATLYVRARKTSEAKSLLEHFRELTAEELAVGTFVVDDKYGMAGKYYFVIGADGLPLPPPQPRPAQRILFSPEPKQVAPPTRAWNWREGQVGIPGIAVADVDHDGDLDVLLAGQDEIGKATILLNDGAGTFTPGASISEGVVSPCFGDIDNDGDVDLWLGRAGMDRVLLNDGAGNFTPAGFDAVNGPDVLTPVARLADVDSDGDLDLLAFRLAAGSVPATGSEKAAPSSVFVNNTDGTFIDKGEDLGLAFPDTAMAAAVYDDFDNDLDLDLILFPAAGAPVAWVNFRVGTFGRVSSEASGLQMAGATSATSGDPDKDGDRDLLVATPRGLRLFLNDGRFRFQEQSEFTAQHGRLGGSGGQFVDMDNDGDLDIILADATRADGTRGPVLLINTWPELKFVDAAQVDPGNLLSAIEMVGDASCVAADFTGDGRCDLLLAPAFQGVILVENVTPGGHWIEFDLAGKRPQDRKARSNNSAIGARVEVKTQRHFQQYVVGGAAGPVASAPLRVHAGLGDHTTIDWLRILWPDAILQGEVELPADRVMTIEEASRKPSSCPYLFAWDGTRFAFVADFGGVGGLGYYVGDGAFARPDPTEYLPLPALAPLDGDYVLQSLTPLEEITYFDQVKLIAVDHPKGTQVQPHEMMAIGVSPPESELFCVHNPIQPLKAVDQTGGDVTDRVLKIDRRYAGAMLPDPRFTGLAAPHSVELDFGQQLAGIDPHARLVLFMYGWVEFGYSSTNYAASQAGQRAKAPTIEVFRNGTWVEVLREVGYPAGVNHMMTVDVTGKILPTDSRVRVTSNMELYWDRIFLGAHDGNAALHVKEVAPRVADLHFRGYPREYSPDGRHPNLADYDNLDRNVAWKLMAGDYTRFGNVRPLLDEADDCFVIMGHGEEITLRFAVDQFGPVPDGCQRTFILKTDSYCKDMDLYTAFPSTVEPLPFHGMSGYPYPAGEHYPDTDKTRQYRSTYNTRRVGSR